MARHTTPLTWPSYPLQPGPMYHGSVPSLESAIPRQVNYLIGEGANADAPPLLCSS